MIVPGSWLGMLGGGQLGRMFTMAAHRLGYRVMVLDPDRDSPAGVIADHHLRMRYDDAQALRELAATCKAVTTEFENVPAASLERLAEDCIVSPSAASLEITQDRAVEKEFLKRIVETVPYAVIFRPQQLMATDLSLFPGILKKARSGYDGKGQVAVATRAEAVNALSQLGAPCVLEKKVDFERELSVVIARTPEGEIAPYPVCENRHVAGVLDVSIAPAKVAAEVAARAVEAASAIAQELSFRGILCVEFFLMPDGRLLANEIAPRPHNSGHFSIDACATSQFEQQVRVLAGLPLGSTSLGQPSVMVNLLGDLWQNGEPDWRTVLEDPRCRLHLYGKRVPRRGRKMGHVTCLGSNADAVVAQLTSLRGALAREPGTRRATPSIRAA